MTDGKTKFTYKSLLVRSRQNLSQNEVRCLILSTEVDSVLGRAGGCSDCGGGEAMSRDGLEQFPTAARDKEPRCDNGTPGGGGLEGVEGGEGDGKSGLSGVARLGDILQREFHCAHFHGNCVLIVCCHMEIRFSHFTNSFIFGRDKPQGARRSQNVIFLE